MCAELSQYCTSPHTWYNKKSIITPSEQVASMATDVTEDYMILHSFTATIPSLGLVYYPFKAVG